MRDVVGQPRVGGPQQPEGAIIPNRLSGLFVWAMGGSGFCDQSLSMILIEEHRLERTDAGIGHWEQWLRVQVRQVL